MYLVAKVIFNNLLKEKQIHGLHFKKDFKDENISVMWENSSVP